ncbi:hypothetical protein CFELI_02520 [Corynebacterium felinum]|uniref:hypothetical protein n=1 Tax=Corynebacterium felinum TaxID=131318 RepID=UPI0025B5E437|nr:hypothetical protein [Corynebacterium felinum]WJY94146.1 hypothetical protein CFELI_02520 [Corynebacterium felinum]
MRQTGVRKLSAVQRSHIDALRAQINEHAPARKVVDVPAAFQEIFPHKGLPRGAVSCMNPSSALAIELIAHTTAAGGYVGVVGWEGLSYAGVESLDTIIVVPQSDLNVVASLAESVDLIFYRGPEAHLSPTQSRPLMAKVRKGVASVVMVGVDVASPAVRLSGRISTFHGIGCGTGRITSFDLELCCQAHGMSRSTTVTIGAGGVAASTRTQVPACAL